MTLAMTKSLGDFCTEAMAILNIIGDENAVDSTDFLRASKQLHLMLRSWQAQDRNLWLRRRDDLEIAENIAEYEMAGEDFSVQSVAQVTVSVSGEDTETPCNIISREDYINYPDKTSTGHPTSVWVREDESQVILTFWPVPDRAYTVHLDYRIPFTEAATRDDLIEVPAHWEEALVYDLAKRLIISFGRSGTGRAKDIVVMAEDLHNTAAAYDNMQDGGGTVRFVVA